MSPEELLQHNLKAADLSEMDISLFGKIQATDRFGVAGIDEWKDTGVRGLRYAVVDSWGGAPLEGNRRIVFEVTRRLNPLPTFYVSEEMGADTATMLGLEA